MEDPTLALPGAQASPLEGEAAARWAEIRFNLDRFAKDLEAGNPVDLKTLSLPRVDPNEILNALHLPESADPYAEALENLLRHIPDGWGRWIGCEKGWFPLIAALHVSLLALDPNYSVEQVKEKYGGLRYYFSSDSPRQGVMQQLVDRAENASLTICEICSRPGGLRNSHGWYKTLCEGCAAELEYPVTEGEPD